MTKLAKRNAARFDDARHLLSDCGCACTRDNTPPSGWRAVTWQGHCFVVILMDLCSAHTSHRRFTTGIKRFPELHPKMGSAPRETLMTILTRPSHLHCSSSTADCCVSLQLVRGSLRHSLFTYCTIFSDVTNPLAVHLPPVSPMITVLYVPTS